MNRRDALRWLLAGGVGAPAITLAPNVHAQSEYSGPVLIDYFAAGGFDQSSFTDPRSDTAINDYAPKPGDPQRPIGMAGNIRFAPMGDNAAFFAKYAKQMLVINGIDCETLDHVHGSRQAASGSLEVGYPTLSEMFAKANGANLALNWLAQASSMSDNVGLATAIPIPDFVALQSLVAPNQSAPGADFMNAADVARLQSARQARAQDQLAKANLAPRWARPYRQTLDAPSFRATISRLAAIMPPQLDAGFEATHVALLCIKAGITSSVQLLSLAGFDTHVNHTMLMNGALKSLTAQIDYLWTKAASLGIAGRITMLLRSEFGRTPLNSLAGKDHWPIGSALVMASGQPAWANRVYGASGPKHEGLKIQPKTGAVDPANGVTITMRHVHAALRQYLNLNSLGTPYDLRVPAGEVPDLFNPQAKTGYPTA